MGRAGTGGNRAAGRSGLRRHAGKNVTQHAPQSVQLIDEVENDRDSVVIDPQVLQIVDQLHPGKIDFGKMPPFAVVARRQPAQGRSRIEMRRSPTLKTTWVYVCGGG